MQKRFSTDFADFRATPPGGSGSYSQTMLTPLSPKDWDQTKAAHLLNRAGFGGTPAHVDSLVRSGMAATVRYLVDGPAAPVPAPAPEWARPTDYVAVREQAKQAMASVPPTDGPEGEAARQAARREVTQARRRDDFQHLLGLSAWWLDRMRASADPLEEKMTLFWHGHFATSAQKVRDAYFMWRQNQTFREHARGNFGTLVKAISRDPAMIQWLDLRESKAAHPNENFAREVMELFTLGEGHYTEKDVTEGARAFTGYRIDPRDSSFRFAVRDHDGTPKTFLGRTDVSDGDQVIDTILAQPACATFLAGKLWTFFASENPPAALVSALANTIRASRYELRPALHQLFTSQEFYAPEAVRTQIKSPIQWIVQTARTLETELPPKGPLAAALKQMGQVPFYPPSVKGWDGGKAWISTSTLLTRYNLAGSLLRVPKRPAEHPFDLTPEMSMAGVQPAPPVAPTAQIDVAKIAPPEIRGDRVTLVRTLAQRLFQGPLAPKDEQAFTDYLKSVAGDGKPITDQNVTGLLHLMMSTPAFQLC